MYLNVLFANTNDQNRRRSYCTFKIPKVFMFDHHISNTFYDPHRCVAVVLLVFCLVSMGNSKPAPVN